MHFACGASAPAGFASLPIECSPLLCSHERMAARRRFVLRVRIHVNNESILWENAPPQSL